MGHNELARAGTVGRYQTIEELGRGAMGVVYKAHDPVIGRFIALKTIAFSDNDGETQEFRRRLYSEASAAGALAHPNIVTIYDIVEERGTTAVAMEFVEGRTLAALIAQEGALPLERALEMMDGICRALDFAGERGIVHRDIKPANILIGADGRPRVADFGIARIPNSTATMTGVIMGSPGYMSPEQVRGQALDRRSDLFSAAGVFYELVTGHRPFAGDDAVATLYRIVHEHPAPPETINPSVGARLGAVVARGLAKNPAERFQTGAELTAALRDAAGLSSGTAARAAATLVSAPPAIGRQLGLVAGVAGLAATAALAWFVLARPAAPAAETLAAASGTGAPVASAASGAAATASSAPAAVATASRTRPASRAVAPGVERAVASADGPAPRVERALPAVGGSSAAVASVPAAIPPSLPAGAARLDIAFEGEAFPVTLYAGATPIGQLAAPGPVPGPSGDARVRAVSEAVFFNRDFGPMPLRPGERRTLQLPGLASAVLSVKEESYSGVRISIDDRLLPGPYPAQVPRLAAGSHVVVYSWIAGPLAGKQLRQTLDVRAGGHFLIRAVPDADQILVQAAR